MTLIEILTTLFILMVGAAGLIALQAASLAGSRFSRDMAIANALVISKAEELRIVTPLPSTPVTGECASLLPCSGGRGEVVDEGGQQAANGRFWRCWCSVTEGTDIQLTVLVAWNDNGVTPTTCGGATHCVQAGLRRRP